jgi:hypothetical protein
MKFVAMILMCLGGMLLVLLGAWWTYGGLSTISSRDFEVTWIFLLWGPLLIGLGYWSFWYGRKEINKMG